jgi:glycerol-3-phosphate dehydrogenase
MAEPNAPNMIMPSSGVHVTLPDYYSPDNLGMIVPKTKDGRVVFMLPWLGETIAGTTGKAGKGIQEALCMHGNASFGSESPHAVTCLFLLD